MNNAITLSGLLYGMIVETNATSWTGDYLYSDFATGKGEKNSALNDIAQIPIVGIGAGFIRIALGIIHTVGHLLAAAYTGNKGHLFHAAKGICEALRGCIEAIPIIGRIFAHLYTLSFFGAGTEAHYYADQRSWWMMKIYNPNQPDGLDKWMNNWINYPQQYYLKA